MMVIKNIESSLLGFRILGLDANDSLNWITKKHGMFMKTKLAVIACKFVILNQNLPYFFLVYFSPMY